MSRQPRCSTRVERITEEDENQPRGWGPPPDTRHEKRASLVLSALALLLVLGVTVELARRPVVGEHLVDAGVPEAPTGYMVQAEPDASVGNVGRPMPRTPLQGQKLEPCDPRIERAIHGACWMPLDVEPGTDACGDKAYLYKGRCYVAVSPARKPDVSVQQ